MGVHAFEAFIDPDRSSTNITFTSRRDALPVEPVSVADVPRTRRKYRFAVAVAEVVTESVLSEVCSTSIVGVTLAVPR
jgi:hypothetical protein